MKLISQAKHILNDWFLMEFLNQPSYEDETDCKRIRRDAEKRKNQIRQGKQADGSNARSLVSLNNCDLERWQKKECKALGMKKVSESVVYIGQVSWDKSIRLLLKKLKIGDAAQVSQDIEKNVTLLSFRLDENMEYVHGSLKLSPLLWTLKRIAGKQKADDLSFITRDSYYKTIKELEERFFAKSGSGKKIGSAAIQRISDEMLKEYVANVFSNYAKKDYSCCEAMTVFYDGNRRPELQYGSMDFFSDDLHMVKNSIGNGDSDLVNFICSLSGNVPINKMNLIPKKNNPEYRNRMKSLLDIGRIPLGKWPSSYRLSLMQQLAVNISSCDNSCSIFSVSGPPGTGKTTLVKDIVADRIVEKARIMATLNTPDDAFDRMRFNHGTKRCNGYSDFFSEWYKLKPKYRGIADNSILIATMSNTAAENITKEMPRESLLQKNCSEHIFSAKETKNAMKEVANLFSVKNGKKESSKVPGASDIYFTEYAKALFRQKGAKQDNKDIWGLVTVPLGNNANKKNFYYSVLNPLFRNCLTNKDIKSRNIKFKEAKKQFLVQLEKTESMRDTIACVANGDKGKQQSKGPRKGLINRLHSIEEDTRKLNAEKRKIEEAMELVSKSIGQYDKSINSVRAEMKQHQKRLDAIDNEIEKWQFRISQMEKNVGFFDRLIKKEKYLQQQKNIDNQKTLLEEKLRVRQAAQDECLRDENAIKKLEKKKEAERSEDRRRKDRINQINQELQSLKDKRKSIELKLQEENKKDDLLKKKVSAFVDGNELTRGNVLNDSYFERLLSDDPKVALKAQLQVPWITEAYNREREKLLYAALQLNREFILSSKACSNNLRHLANSWGYGYSNERTPFHPEDRKKAMPSLIDTLFILVPAVSSTFASIGNFFRDVKKTDAIGTLIIDEASQATPQMAVGAMYRAKKTIVVGDEEQLEPIENDDLKLLKSVFANDLLPLYREASLSVQRMADAVNPYGTYITPNNSPKKWIGCPLLVHRRCQSPMYEIANEMSYGGIMKNATPKLSKDKAKNLCYATSKWFDVHGPEAGKDDHYVEKQGRKVCEILERAFAKKSYPDLYVISPFRTVIDGVKKEINTYCRKHPESHMATSKNREAWMKESVDTVHKFQGKEAAEVIFVLGCEAGTQSEGAIKWVNRNLVNVAVTRARYRLYVIGDKDAWKWKPCMQVVEKRIEEFEAVPGKEHDNRNQEKYGKN